MASSVIPQPVLPVSFRPSVFSEMIGQGDVIRMIRNQLSSGRVPSAWLLSGPPGSGKTTLATMIAWALESGMPVENWGLEPPKRDPLIINASEMNGVDMARQMAEEAEYFPPAGMAKRVFVLDEAHRMTVPAQNILLVPVEKSTTTAWIFCTTEPEKLIPALRRRLYHVKLKGLDAQGRQQLIWSALNRLNLKNSVDPEKINDLLKQLSLFEVESPGLVLAALEKFLAGEPPEDCVSGGTSPVEAIQLCRAVARKDWNAIRTLISDMDAETLLGLRHAVLAYLRKILLSDTSKFSARQTALAMIESLSGDLPVESVAASALLTARLYKLCNS